jgi:uncharacterized protein YaeQ
MALKPTIYKARVELADSDRNCFDSLSLTIAQHPSETVERMTTRVLAYCLNAGRGVEFTRGLSTTEEPDIWCYSDSGELDLWIEIGQPEEPRLRKACGKAGAVKVYAFGKSANTWWQLNGEVISALPRLEVWQFGWEETQALAGLLDRTMQWNVSVVGGVVYVDNGKESVSLEPMRLT